MALGGWAPLPPQPPADPFARRLLLRAQRLGGRRGSDVPPALRQPVLLRGPIAVRQRHRGLPHDRRPDPHHERSPAASSLPPAPARPLLADPARPLRVATGA